VAWRRFLENRGTYWSQTRRPFPCLVFVLPFLLAYELGVAWLGGSGPDAGRAGADLWIRQGLAAIGVADPWLPPLGLVLVLLLWQATGSLSWRFNGLYLLGMILESILYALGLIGLNRLLDLVFVRLEAGEVLLAAGGDHVHAVAQLVGFLGAGVYEEVLFRLALLPVLYRLARLLQAPEVVAGTLALTGSSFLFALAHHAGMPGESFTWYAFIFRWMAGVVFAWIYLIRGFGIAVGSHAAYDVFVGWLGWTI
jgi:membrane protease YdiL (CAAX protease family)